MARSNAAKIQLVLARIEAGESERAACEAENISRSTFRTTALRASAGDQYARALEGLALDQIEKLEQTIQDMRDGSLDPAIGILTFIWYQVLFSLNLLNAHRANAI